MAARLETICFYFFILVNLGAKESNRILAAIKSELKSSYVGTLGAVLAYDALLWPSPWAARTKELRLADSSVKSLTLLQDNDAKLQLRRDFGLYGSLFNVPQLPYCARIFAVSVLSN